MIVSALPGCRKQPSDSIEAGAQDANTFTVAFYNVENLFDNEYDGGEYPEYRPGPGWTAEMHRIKMENIASVIHSLDASVIALCEVEDEDALRQLQYELKKKGTEYPYRSIAEKVSKANTAPALLSKFPVKNTITHLVHLPDLLPTRPIFEARIEVRKQPLTLFINHWPSKHHAESYRLSAAKVLGNQLLQHPAGTDYLIVGDLNCDYDEFATFGTSGHDDTDGKTGINDLLGTVVRLPNGRRRLRTEQALFKAPFPAHYDLWLELPPQKRMSYFYQGNMQTTDHIIISAALYDSSGIAYVDNSFRVFDMNGMLLENGIPRRWKMRYRNKKKYHVGEGFSDHLPVMASFALGGFSGSALDSARVIINGESPRWFEEHANGWMACANAYRILRDTTEVFRGTYALHVMAAAQKSNKTAIRTVIQATSRDSAGTIRFHIKGSGRICFRTKSSRDKWRYYRDVDKKLSGRAHYSTVSCPQWRPIVLDPHIDPSESVELEMRCGKGAALDMWIDR